LAVEKESTKWDNFQGVISKAKTACELSGEEILDHFADVGKTIQMSKGAEKEIPDLMLTRYLATQYSHQR
jgi:DNA-damage-inducible protein D